LLPDKHHAQAGAEPDGAKIAGFVAKVTSDNRATVAHVS